MTESWKEHFEPLIMERMNMMDEDSHLWDYIRYECDEDEARLQISRVLFREFSPFIHEQQCLDMMSKCELLDLFQFAHDRDDCGMIWHVGGDFLVDTFNWVWVELGYDHIQSEWGAIMEQYENCHK